VGNCDTNIFLASFTLESKKIINVWRIRTRSEIPFRNEFPKLVKFTSVNFSLNVWNKGRQWTEMTDRAERTTGNWRRFHFKHKS